MLLRFNIHQGMYSVFYAVLCPEVTCKGCFSYSNKEKNKIEHYISDLIQHRFGFMLHFRVYYHKRYSFLCII